MEFYINRPRHRACLFTESTWTYQWKMQLNPDPTKQAVEMIFPCKRNKQNHPPLHFGGNLVEQNIYQKHLGLVLHDKFSFRRHIQQKIGKARKINPLSRYLPTKTLETIYKSFIRPHLDYHEPSKINALGQSLSTIMEEIERVQYQAALVVTGTWKGTSRSKLYEELG